MMAIEFVRLARVFSLTRAEIIHLHPAGLQLPGDCFSYALAK